MRIVISAGHGRYIRGASGVLDEVFEARRVTARVAQYLQAAGVDVLTYADNESTSQNENLNRIVDFHNAQQRDLDVSVHFNAYVETTGPMGTECLYVTQHDLAARVSSAVAHAGVFIDRGPKERTDLFFLNSTEEPAILIETCFVDSETDADLYRQHFDAICRAIAQTIGERDMPDLPELPEQPPPEMPPDAAGEGDVAMFRARGSCSWFGGPNDHGVDADEDLAFLYDFEDAPHLMLSDQPPGTTGLARRLDPGTFYVACRWNYNVTPKDMLRDQSLKALVRANGKAFLAYPADWGPHEDTGRVADLSPALMDALGLETDDEVEVSYPAPE